LAPFCAGFIKPAVHPFVAVCLWLATKGSPRPFCCPSPRWGGEENGRNRQKLVGRDKGSLTEQQTKGTVKTTIQIRGIHKTKRRNAESNSHCPMMSCVLNFCDQLPPRPAPQLEPSMAAHGMEYPVLFGQIGSDCPAVSLPGFR